MFTISETIYHELAMLPAYSTQKTFQTFTISFVHASTLANGFAPSRKCILSSKRLNGTRRSSFSSGTACKLIQVTMRYLLYAWTEGKLPANVKHAQLANQDRRTGPIPFKSPFLRLDPISPYAN